MLNVVVVGLGPIGLAAAEAVDADPGMRLVAAVDIDPQKVGRRLSSILGRTLSSDPVVAAELEPVRQAEVAIVCTASHFDRLVPILRGLIATGTHAVSSCEEMAWPWYRHRALADDIDAEAERGDVALLGTGVNPGYVMDLLAVQLSSMVLRVSRVRCVRVVDALTRRRPLQAKIGSGMTVEAFEAVAAEGGIGHKGIAESVAMIAAGLGVSVEPGSVREALMPVVAERKLTSLVGDVLPGQVRGMRNTATWTGSTLSIELDLTMALGEADPHDAVELDGSTPLHVRVPGSTPGDTATVASLVNAARLLPRVKPGLRSMLDLPAAASRAG
jgi:hypothetical protein